MNAQDNPTRNLFTSLNNSPSNAPPLPNNQSKPANTLNNPGNLSKDSNISGGIIPSFPKTKKAARGKGNSSFS